MAPVSREISHLLLFASLSKAMKFGDYFFARVLYKFKLVR